MRAASIHASRLSHPIAFIRCGWIALGTALLLVGGAATSAAGTIDLSTALSGSGVNQDVAGQLFFADWVNAQSTGTGVITSFLRIDSNNNTVEQGYNTSLGTPMDDQPGHTNAITLAQVAQTAVQVGGVTYYRFLLDINQTGSEPLLSLNQVEIFADSVDPGTTGTAPQPTAGASTTLTLPGASEVFRMSQPQYPSSGSGTEIVMNFALNHGSGSGDMMLFVNAGLFASFAPSSDIILYSEFGNPPGGHAQNDGPEEWSLFSGPCITVSCGATVVRPDPVPEPMSLVLLGTGLLGAAARYRRRKS